LIGARIFVAHPIFRELNHDELVAGLHGAHQEWLMFRERGRANLPYLRRHQEIMRIFIRNVSDRALLRGGNLYDPLTQIYDLVRNNERNLTRVQILSQLPDNIRFELRTFFNTDVDLPHYKVSALLTKYNRVNNAVLHASVCDICRLPGNTRWDKYFCEDCDNCVHQRCVDFTLPEEVPFYCRDCTQIHELANARLLDELRANALEQVDSDDDEQAVVTIMEE